MIARIWKASATRDGAGAYERHFTAAVLPELQGIDGHCGAYLLKQENEDQVLLQVVTLWESFDSIKAFAGADFDTAVVEPDAKAVLLTFDSTVAHHEVAVASVG